MESLEFGGKFLGTKHSQRMVWLKNFEIKKARGWRARRLKMELKALGSGGGSCLPSQLALLCSALFSSPQETRVTQPFRWSCLVLNFFSAASVISNFRTHV